MHRQHLIGQTIAKVYINPENTIIILITALGDQFRLTETTHNFPFDSNNQCEIDKIHNLAGKKIDRIWNVFCGVNFRADSLVYLFEVEINKNLALAKIKIERLRYKYALSSNELSIKNLLGLKNNGAISKFNRLLPPIKT